jgi:hypothetical protein
MLSNLLFKLLLYNIYPKHTNVKNNNAAMIFYATSYYPTDITLKFGIQFFRDAQLAGEIGLKPIEVAYL